MSQKKYTLTPEHKAQFDAIRDKWIENALSTTPATEDEIGQCREAVKKMYELAGLTPPPDHRIVFVPSPFAAHFASGFASAIWYLRNNGKPATRAATYDATDAATDDYSDVLELEGDFAWVICGNAKFGN